MTTLIRGKLSRVVPQHIRSVTFTWVNPKFLPMSPEWRSARDRMRKPLNNCRWCKHAFRDGEMMALAHPEKQANWLLCQTCVSQLATPDSASPVTTEKS